MVRPVHTFNFLAIVLALLLLLMLVFPEGGIKISDDLALYFPGFKEWWNDNPGQSGSQSAAFMPEMVEEDLDGYVEPSDALAQVSDSLDVDSLAANYVPRPIQVDQIHQPLELPDGSFKCLETLFQSLMNPAELSKVVRIIHYGDSQIEADRISNYLRYKLQQQFGGSGPGLVPAKTAYDYKAPCAVENIGTWMRYTIFPFVDTTVKHSRYGAMAAFSRFAPMRKPIEEPKQKFAMQAPDSTASADSLAVLDSIFTMPNIVPEPPEPSVMEKMYYASLRFQPATFGHANVKDIKRVRMLYGFNQRPFSVKVRDGEQELYNDSIKAVNGYAIKTWNFGTAPQDLYMDFAGADSPEVYGFAMDGNGGVAVDNIPLRGCSGTIFTRIDGTTLAQMYNDLNVKCIILQFGGNAVPSLQPGSTAGFKNFLAAQIRYLKRLHPGVSIILIGPADMSCKVEGTDRYETYPVLPELVNALKRAAFENDCAFWDMYAAMGGWNTMPDWVNHDPAYAAPDYVHFSGTGANIMARMFYSALIARYNEYITQ
ncbi:MAG: GDSL-type esterase/lipase family protein [Bacteroidales bacterium]|nr:GDSL-type esterase/lipase family protein [Bacteroidales bacterium]